MNRFFITNLLSLFLVSTAYAGTGTEAASFLDIPIGAEPAALGSAYTARAENSYATVWNPAGLGRVETAELSAMYLSYLVDTSYQQASIAIPLVKDEDQQIGIGLSAQTLGSGKIEGRDENGARISDFSTRFSAYTLGVGLAVSKEFSLGTSLKVIQEKISDASASAYALDGGLLYSPSSRLTLGAAIANLGSNVKFANQTDPLPLQIRAGAAWRMSETTQLLGETVYRRNGVFTGHFGTEWSPSSTYALRLGYQTHHTKELGAMAGLTGGLGVRWKGQELSYAFVPFGDLGSTHYFSVILRWSTKPRQSIAFPDRTGESGEDFPEEKGTGAKSFSGYSDYRNLYDILSDEERKSMKKIEEEMKDVKDSE